jgi:hypothetical protein
MWHRDTALGNLRDRVAADRVDGTDFDRIFIERSTEMVIVTAAGITVARICRP